MPNVNRLQRTIAIETQRLKKKYGELTPMISWQVALKANERGTANLVHLGLLSEALASLHPDAPDDPAYALRVLSVKPPRFDHGSLERWIYFGNSGIIAAVGKTATALTEITVPFEPERRLDAQMRKAILLGSGEVGPAAYERAATILGQG